MYGNEFVYHESEYTCRCGQAKLFRIGKTACYACLKCGANAFEVAVPAK
jgi:Zn finger protein HypA/HybF involved in hydrogenase expression